MFPELFRIPGLGIPIATYGVLLAIGFIAALWLTAQLAARDGLPKDRIYDLGLYILAASLIGSKLLMVITEWSDYRGEWRRVLSFDLWRSGGVFYGGFLIALLVSVILMRKWHLPWRKTSDAFAPGVALGHAIGASGARVLTTLLYALKRRNLKRGIASLCLGGGNGVALAIERL